MGKASQAKKAAREARESGRTPERARRRLGYPLVVALAVVLGVLAVWYARRPATTSVPDLVTPVVQTDDGAVPSTSTPVGAATATTAATTATTVAP